MWLAGIVVADIALLGFRSMDPPPEEEAVFNGFMLAIPLIASAWLANELRKISASPKTFRFYYTMLVLWLAGLVWPVLICIMPFALFA